MANTHTLLEGFKRFKQTYFGDDKKLYASMKEGQPAKTLMVACCDSRVDPAILTDCDPGDIFTVRNVANLVPPCEEDQHHHGTSSAIEYAVTALKVESIIVMGHANCGGIKGLWESDDLNDSQFIHRWVSIAQEAKEWVKVNHATESNAVQLKACEQRAILVSLQNLMGFDFVRERVEAGSLRLHGWYFDLAAGELLCYNPESNKFEQPQ
ncbi:carbonic anhydrase [Methylophaga thiooxydans]|uniref:Carbonic anhydrase n=1 Tax=Methylophaga thiooxydans DMS010 TaxID=637616 RepID=C0N2Q0_9GAMM|nr:carbonic anhydrase [Methylophaga thiooxydans]EEF80960.1 Carbonic anhydrase [Methylophaga thiooxydans DMS010]